MDLEFSTPSFLFSSLLFLLLVLNIRKRFKNNGRSINLPPGPWKLPIIGNLHQLLGALPHYQLRDLARKYGPLMHLQIGELSTVVVSSVEFAEQVMKSHDVIFASRPYNPAANFLSYNSTDIIFSPYGDYWRKLRKLCTLELLSKKRVQSFRSIREEEALNLINRIASTAAGSPVNLTYKVYSFTCGVTSRAAFGKKCKDQEEFLSAVNETGKLLGGFNIEDLFPSINMLLRWVSGIRSRLEKLHHATDRILENIVNEHNNQGKTTTADVGKSNDEENHEDLVDVLLKVQQDGDIKLTIDNIKAVIWDIFSAGIETSTTTIDWVMSELMKNPTLMKKAQIEVRRVFNQKGKLDEMGINEMKYLKAVIKETLRLHPAAPLLSPRECRKSCKIKEFDIPIKTKVLINAWAIGRDPKNWSEPERFVPERFIDSPLDYNGTHFEYLPFGAGRRMCPGMSFGLANIEIALATLLYHFDWKLPNEMMKQEEDLNMTEVFGITVKRKDDLCLIPIPYHPSM